MENEPTVAPLPPNQPIAPHTSDSFFNAIRRFGIERTPDSWVGGVAAGIAHRLGWDPLLVRGIFVVSFFLGGLGLIIYGLGWALLPTASDGRIHLQDAIHGRFDPALIGAGLVTFAGMVTNGPLGGVFGFISRSTGFLNFEFFHIISTVFGIAFWTVALVLFIRWLMDRSRMRKHLKNLPDYTAQNSFNEPVSAGLTNDDEPFLFDAATETAVPLTTAVITETVIDEVITDDAADPIALKAAQKAAAKAEAEKVALERAQERAAANEAKAEARVKLQAEKAYYRQQRDIEKYRKAVERSRVPITKGPGMVTLLLTLGSLFLVWTLAQAAIRGLMPIGLGATAASPVLWAGVALLVLGLGIFISGIRGRKSGVLNGLAWLGLVALIPLSIFTAGIFGGQVAWGQGATDWVRPAATAQAIGSGPVRPINVTNAELGFRGRFGSPTIDLTELDLSHATAANPVTIPIEFSAGDVTVILPPEARTEANVRLSAGQVNWQITVPDGVELEHPQYGTVANHGGDDLIVTWQTVEVASPLRSAIYLASDAARLHGANLRLVISNGAGNVTLRETTPASTPQLVNQ